jgi:hypothetical protein
LYLAALPAATAQRYLRDHGERAFSPDGVEKLVLLATGSAALADDALCRRREQQMADADQREGG